jgi:hypothetical protein
VKAFSGLDLHGTTDGGLNASSLFEKNILMCFARQPLNTFLPISLSLLLATIEVPFKLVTVTIASPLFSLACLGWKDITEVGEPLWDAVQHRFERARKASLGLEHFSEYSYIRINYLLHMGRKYRHSCLS